MSEETRSVFISGNFNIVHPGHIRLLRFARSLGGRLTVGVNSDDVGGGAVHLPQDLRLDLVRANSWVDEVLLIDRPVEEVIAELRPNIVVKGKEFEGRYNVEQEVVEGYGGQVVFSSGEVTFSSSDLLKKTFTSGQAFTFNIPPEFAQRYQCQPRLLRELIEKFKELRVCVIGDLIVDQYINCDALGMSQEDPSIVLRPIDNTRFVGGAGIVAAHAAGIGATVDLITITGKDENSDFAMRTLNSFKVNSHLIVDDTRPTTLKSRYRVDNKTLFRVSQLHQASVSNAIQNKVFKIFEERMHSYDLLVFSDFNYGCLPRDLVSRISMATEGSGIVRVADSQSSSQIGDIGKFQRMHLLTPTERETRLSLRNYEDGLAVVAQTLFKSLGAANLFQKLGSEGLIFLSEDEAGQLLFDRLPALNSSPLDVAGAGDSLLIAAGCCLAVGGTCAQAAAIGSLAAALQISRVGNTPITHDILAATINW